MANTRRRDQRRYTADGERDFEAEGAIIDHELRIWNQRLRGCKPRKRRRRKDGL